MLQHGDKVFYSDNGKGPSKYAGLAYRIIVSFGLTPLIYGGAGVDTRQSSLDREIRDDFYGSKIVILVLGVGEDWKGIGDNWAIPELEHAVSRKTRCFVYLTGKITEAELKDFYLPVSPVLLRDEEHFEAALKQALELLLLPSNPQ